MGRPARRQAEAGHDPQDQAAEDRSGSREADRGAHADADQAGEGTEESGTRARAAARTPEEGPMRGVRCAAAVVLALTSSAAVAQESRVAADLRREGDDVQSSCSGFDAKAIVGCVVTLATDEPFHVAIGSLAPKHGTEVGLAFAEHSTPNDRWRIGWNADAVAATSGSRRAGAYAKLVYRPPTPIVVVRPGATPPPGTTPRVTITEYPVVNVYAQ